MKQDMNVKGGEIESMGYPKTIARKLAMMAFYRLDGEKSVRIDLLKKVLESPDKFIEDPILSELAKELLPKPVDTNVKNLMDKPAPFTICGRELIEDEAVKQMSNAALLPVSAKGFLAPDAHGGYGLPIGGVLATRNAVIPYGVGVDIGCRMALSILDGSEKHLSRYRDPIKRDLILNTKFGMKDVHDDPIEHEILDRINESNIKMVNNLSKKASIQIGSSGGGNHFVDVGVVELFENNPFGASPGKYIGVLSHSGSRGFGAALANHYTKIAMEKCVLPQQAKHLAWLDMDSEEGIEYWEAMTLAGDYASACHYDIHRRMVKSMGMNVIGKVENHHNYAWKEIHDGEELIVHRKGATPAGKGVMGIIPGSMVSPAYIVMGKGNSDSIHSASHGAGRLMSRTQAKNSFTRKDVKEVLLSNDVSLTGGDVDEAPMAYKDIREVMKLQTDLVDVVGEFIPKIVRMAND